MKHPPLEDYHIGIICALTIEQAAARAMLDEDYGMIDEKSTNDHNIYFAGRVHKHHVVIACLPAGVDGIASATNVAAHMLSTFTQIRFGLLVGIGGGIPNLDANVDIRLGDVVVSQPQGNYGGVVQHDKGKHEAGNSWKPKGMLNAPPLALLIALKALQTSHELEDSKIPIYMAQMLEKWPKLKRIGYGYPGAQKDVLHLPVNNLEAHTMTETSGGTTVAVRNVRLTNDPQIHYGIIASGNSVIKESSKRDQLRHEYGALCVEMEAAGLMNHFPCLVIRGICDYADQHKNDEWHRYAAATAAAFSKEILLYISKEETRQETPVSVLLDSLTQHFQQIQEHNQQQQAFNQKQQIKQEYDKYQRCHQIFAANDYEGDKNFNPEPVKGTCRWVLDHPTYLGWRQNPENNLLWISADPGCGKSVLSRYLVDSYLEDINAPDTGSRRPHTICYFFFKDKDSRDRSVTALSAILHQLFSQQPTLIRHAISAYDRKRDQLLHQKDELWRIFQSAISDPEAQPIVCVLDALDECHETDRQWLIGLICRSFIDSSSTSSHRALKWLITSRPYNDIQYRFEQDGSNFRSIRLRGEDENDQIRKEIDLVIQQKVRELAREVSLPETKVGEITRQLIAMENRTYLWLYLAMDEMKRTFYASLRPAGESIEKVPASVEAAYDKILSRVTQSAQTQVKAILSIVIGARRALTIAEMALALDIASLPVPPQSIRDLTQDSVRLEKNIRDWCGLFIFINHGRLYLIHQTAKDFLLRHSDTTVANQSGWKRCLRSVGIEREMARICVQFLCLDNLVQHLGHDEISGTLSDIEHENRLLPSIQSFFAFAAKFWAEHVRTSESTLDKLTQSRVRTLYNTTSEVFPHWTSAMWRATPRGHLKFGMNSIRLAAFNGHPLLLCYLIEKSKDHIDAQDSNGFTALLWAVVMGHLDAVNVLLDLGADINGPGSRFFYSSALFAASMNGYRSIVELLLNRGAEINARTEKDNDSALHAASRWAHQEVVELLLSRGADMITHTSHGSPLQSASADGHQGIVELLLRYGADIDAQGGKYHGSALEAASAGGHYTTVELLLKKGADIKAQGEGSGSALYAASAWGHLAIVELLLSKGADVNAPGAKYGSALVVASARGQQAIVRLLLDNGADVNVSRGKKGSALLAASTSGHEAIVRLLLDWGADKSCLESSNVDNLHDVSGAVQGLTLV